MMQVFLQTERLVLRQFTEEDAEHLFALDRDPDVMRFINGGQLTAYEVIRRDILPRLLQDYQEYAGYGCWAIIEKTSTDFIGWFHFWPGADTPDAIELGYRLRKAAWGNGYATEGARALIHKGFTELGTQRVVARALAANTASIRVMEKVGLKFVRRFTYEGPVAWRVGQVAVEYALHRREWTFVEQSAP